MTLLENAFSGFGGEEFYPTKEEKGYSLISNHAFVDDNKRIGVYVMLTFLEVNGIHLDCTNEDVVKAGLGVADGSMDYEALLAWVREQNSDFGGTVNSTDPNPDPECDRSVWTAWIK